MLTNNAQSTYLSMHLSTHALQIHPFADAGPHCIHPLNGNVQKIAFSHFSLVCLLPHSPTHSLSSPVALLTLTDVLT